MAKKETVSRGSSWRRQPARAAADGRDCRPCRALAPADATATTKLPHRHASGARPGSAVPILRHGLRQPVPHVPRWTEGLRGCWKQGDRCGIHYLDTAVPATARARTRDPARPRQWPPARKEVFLATKVPTRPAPRRRAQGGRGQLEAAWQTDRPRPADTCTAWRRERPREDRGPGRASQVRSTRAAARAEGRATAFMTRGRAAHTGRHGHGKAIERHDLDCVQMAMNPARGRRFEELALPAANKKNSGSSS